MNKIKQIVSKAKTKWDGLEPKTKEVVKLAASFIVLCWAASYDEGCCRRCCHCCCNCCNCDC